MSNMKTIGTILLVAGIIIVITALTSDMLGIGSDVRTFGTKQIIAVAAGVIAAVVGFVLRSRKQA
jgi:hypothetical protein